MSSERIVFASRAGLILVIVGIVALVVFFGFQTGRLLEPVSAVILITQALLVIFAIRHIVENVRGGRSSLADDLEASTEPLGAKVGNVLGSTIAWSAFLVPVLLLEGCNVVWSALGGPESHASLRNSFGHRSFFFYGATGDGPLRTFRLIGFLWLAIGLCWALIEAYSQSRAKKRVFNELPEKRDDGRLGVVIILIITLVPFMFLEACEATLPGA